jgi:hypothetical protein
MNERTYVCNGPRRGEWRARLRGWLARVLGALAVLGLGVVPVGAQTPAQPSSKLGWTQPELSPADALTLRYTLYVDNVAAVLAGVTCEAVGGATECKAPLPPLLVGLHTLELSGANMIDPQAPAESPRSAPFAIRFYVAPSAPSGLKLTQ